MSKTLDCEFVYYPCVFIELLVIPFPLPPPKDDLN